MCRRAWGLKVSVLTFGSQGSHSTSNPRLRALNTFSVPWKSAGMLISAVEVGLPTPPPFARSIFMLREHPRA